MAHMIDNSKGFNAFIAFQAPGWHGLGEVFTEPIRNAKEALVRSGADFHVLKLPNVHLIPQGQNPDGTPNFMEIISENSFFTYRTDVNKVLGDRLGKIFEVLQNEEAFNLVDEILQSGRAQIETAGVIDEGRKVFICLKLDKSIFVGREDETKQYAVIVSAHDGSMATTILFTNIRVVCNNTMSAALREATGAIKVRHTTNQADRLKEAAKVLRLIDENTAINEENYNTMKDIIISKEDMMNYFGNIFLTAEEIKELREGKKAKEVISTRKQNQLNEVLNFANNGVGQKLALNNGQLNMYYAYNAVTGYTTGKKYKNASDRAESLLYGDAQTTITKAGALALAPEKIQVLSKVNFNGMNLN